MEKIDVSLNTKLEIAIEILAAKIGITSNQGYKVSDDIMKKLLQEREQMYRGNQEIIEKIINEYGPQIKIKNNKGE